MVPYPTRSEPPSVPRARADCGGHVFTAKLGVVVHNLVHQLFDHLLPDRAVLTLPPYRFNGPTFLLVRRPAVVPSARHPP